MKKLLIKKTLYAVSYLFFALLIEIITFNVIGIGTFPSYFWLDVAIVLLISAVIFIIPSFIAQSILICALLLLQGVISVANDTLYGMSGFVFNLSMLNLLNEVGGVFELSFINFGFLFSLLAVIATEVVILIFLRKIRVKNCFRFNVILPLLFVFCLSGGLSEGLYFLQKSAFYTTDVTDEFYVFKDSDYLYDTQFLTAAAYKEFGTFGFYYKNIANFITEKPIVNARPTEKDIQKNVTALNKYFSSGERSSSLQNYDASGNIKTGILNGQNIVLIVIESGEWYAINQKYTPTLYALAQQGVSFTKYYARDKTNHSEAMSILGSYPSALTNSIAPSISNPNGLLSHDFAFSLPNILQENGYTTNYFHANSGSYYKREATFSDLYGFDHAYFKDNMQRLKNYNKDTEFFDFTRDSEVISQYLNEFTKTDSDDDSFFSMLMTLTSHGSYSQLLDNGDYTKNMSAAEKEKFSESVTLKNLEVYYERIDDYPKDGDYLSETPKIVVEAFDKNGEPTEQYLRYKQYQAAIMDLDVGVNRLICELQETGKLENTTFFFYSDHNCYYSDQQYILKGANKGTQWDTFIYNIPCFFWSGKYMDLSVLTDLYDGVEYVNNEVDNSVYNKSSFYDNINYNCAGENYGGLQITKFCNSFDLLPTLLDLLGYDYNINLYQGISIFDESESVFVSRESGLFNADMYTDGLKIYIKGKESGCSFISADGQIAINGGNIEIVSGGVQKNYLLSEVEKYVGREGDFIVYDLDTIFAGSPDHRNYFSDSVAEFLSALSVYYKKQDMLELMYGIDYFKYADINELINKI